MRTAASSTRWSSSSNGVMPSISSRSKRSSGAQASSTKWAGPPTLRRSSTVCRVQTRNNVEHYAKIIKEKATLRNLIFSANKILATAYDAEEEADTDSRSGRARDLRNRRRQDPRRVSYRCAISRRDSLDTIEKLHAHKELVTGSHDRLHRPGRDDVGPSARGPHPSSPPGRRWVNEPRAQHRAACGNENEHDGRHLQPRNVEGAAVPPHAHGRSENRCAPAPRGISRRTRLGPLVGSDRHAQPRRRFSSTVRRRSACSMRAKCRRLAVRAQTASPSSSTTFS